jgi:hypothetical protein
MVRATATDRGGSFIGFETAPIPGKPDLLSCLSAAYRLYKAGGNVAAVRTADDNDREAAQRSSVV